MHNFKSKVQAQRFLDVHAAMHAAVQNRRGPISKKLNGQGQ
ncbi:MAG: hypothetical protein P8J17_13075 [Halioglobus sp.]|nr:hypothetical protein [Halioglobus sp.]